MSKLGSLSIGSPDTLTPKSTPTAAEKSGAGGGEERQQTPKKAKVSHGRKPVGVQMTPAAHKQVKKIAFDREINVHDVLAEALNEYFEKRGLPALA